MQKLQFALKNHISTLATLEKAALQHVKSSKTLKVAIREFPSAKDILDAKTSAKLAFAARSLPSATEALGRTILNLSETSPKLAFASRTFRRNFSLDRLLKMKEAELVEIAGSLGIKASKKDLKNDTIEKIIRKQSQ